MGLGIRFFSDSHNCNCIKQKTLEYIKKYSDIEPNPKFFKIIKTVEFGNNILFAVIHYKNCTTHSGYKILVYDNIGESQLLKMKEIDPHFLENNTSPCARFPFTESGNKHAILFCKTLAEEKK